MSARRAAKAGAAGSHNGRHRPGVECPWAEPQCAECVTEFAVHTAWMLTGKSRPWGHDHEHAAPLCFECRRSVSAS